MQRSYNHRKRLAQMMIESKESRKNEKVGREIAKCHHFDERAMNFF
jgi:hypothetical protein